MCVCVCVCVCVRVRVSVCVCVSRVLPIQLRGSRSASSQESGVTFEPATL